jgi:ring-1,2-phenylacetyl-CoA epoxidase subunit PaaE
MEFKKAEGSLTIQSVHYDGPDAVRIGLMPPHATAHEWIGKPGAFITFSITPDLQRSYTLVNPSESLPLEIRVKSIHGGKGSRFFNQQVKIGTRINATLNKSSLWRSEWDQKPQHFVCFAGGIGITPIFSLIQYVMRRPDCGHKITLIYCNRSRKTSLFTESLYELKDRITFIPLYSEDESINDSHEVGHLTDQRMASWLNSIKNPKKATYVVSAPPELMRKVHRGLDTADIPMNRRHTERFTSAGISNALPPLSKSPTRDRPECSIQMERDHGIETFKMHGEGQSILDAALSAGLPVPYSCRGGVCMSCLAHVTEGQVQSEGDNGLTEKEQQDGMILCCRSQPQSSALKIRFIN